MNQYIIDSSRSEYFGITCYEIEHYKSKTHNETWVKVVFDYPTNGTFKEKSLWFKREELELI